MPSYFSVHPLLILLHFILLLVHPFIFCPFLGSPPRLSQFTRPHFLPLSYDLFRYTFFFHPCPFSQCIPFLFAPSSPHSQFPTKMFLSELVCRFISPLFVLVRSPHLYFHFALYLPLILFFIECFNINKIFRFDLYLLRIKYISYVLIFKQLLTPFSFSPLISFILSFPSHLSHLCFTLYLPQFCSPSYLLILSFY